MNTKILRRALISWALGWSGVASAQLPEVWAAHYTTDANVSSYARAMTLDGAGNIYLAGSAANDSAIARFDSSGNLVWAASYSGRGGFIDGHYAITVDTSGNVYVTGATTGNRFYYFDGTTRTYLTDAVTVKYDSRGRQQWASSYSENGRASYIGRALAVDGTGNVYVVGGSFLLKYSANGHQAWLLTGYFGTTLAMDGASNLYVTGSGTRKLDSNGNQVWSNSFSGTVLALDRAGLVHVIGASTNVAGGSAIKRLDANGNEVWSAEFGGTASALAFDGLGNVVAAGFTSLTNLQNGSLYPVFLTVKYAPNGTRLWAAQYQSANPSYTGSASSVVADDNGNVFVSGLAYASVSAYVTLKYDPNGNPLWIGRHPGTGPSALSLDGAGNVYVAGTDPANLPQFLALKYAQPGVTGMPQIQTQPKDTIAFIGDTASYSVTATGHGSLSYQWYYQNYQVYPLATNSTLSVTNVGPSSVGLYSVEVGDSVGLVVSTQANLVVVAPPATQAVLTGDDVEFDAWTFGSVPVTYQWQFNGANLPGRSDLSLSLPNVTASQSGDYRVVASAFGNSITSAPAHLAVETLVHQSWVARYDDPANSEDRPNAMKVDAAGNVYVTGISANYGTGYDYATAKYNSNGQRLWVARYDGSAGGWDEARGLALDRLGNVYVTGLSWSISTNGYSDPDCVTIKYGPNGSRIWVARYTSGVNLEDGGQALTVDDAGNVYVAGYSGSTNNGLDYVTIKYDSHGNQLWAARYDGPAHYNDLPHDIAVDPAGNVYVTGESAGTSGSSDYSTLKYEPNGNLLWAARYNGPGNSTDIGYRLRVDSAGHVYVSGASFGNGTDFDIATLKYDSNGNQLWLARYNGLGNGDDEMRDVALDAAGNLYISGWAYSTNSGSDYVTIKYSPNGQQLWLASYDGPGHGDDKAWALAVDLAGNTYVTGQSQKSQLNSYGYITSDYDYATVKYDSSGRQLWVARFDNPSHTDDFGQLIGLDGAGNVYVSGYSVASYSYDYLTVKYTQAANDTLSITGPAGFTSGGPVGGPFSVTAQTLTLSNQGMANLAWQASSDASWLSVSPTSGLLSTSLPPVNVTVSLNSIASNLNAGFYSANVWFTNTSNGFLQLRQFVLAIAEGTYGGAVLALIPPAYWPLNETNQPPPADVVTNAGLLGGVGNGFGLGGTNSTSPPQQGEPGIVGQSFRFSNPALDAGFFGSHVDVPHHQALNPSGAFSIELWAKPARAVPDLFCMASSVDPSLNAGNSRFGWVLYQTPTNWEFRLGGGFNGYAATNDGGSVVVGSWNHVVGTYDGANVRLFFNGQLVSGPSPVSGFSPNTNNTIPLRLGATTLPNRTFDGWVDEVAFYTNALGAARIAAHYNTGSTAASQYAAQVLADYPAGYWHLDEPAYSAPGALPAAINLGFLRDEADGVYQPSSLPGVPGVPGLAFGLRNSACRFNGAGYIDMAGSALDFTGPLSLVLWTKADPANGNVQTIASKGAGSYQLLLDGSGHPHFANGQQPSGDLVGPDRIDDGAWHQLAGVYDGVNSEFLYVDGQLVASTRGATHAVTGNRNDLFIGGNPDIALFQLFNGVVDEVCILTNALSPAQVEHLYAVGANVAPPPPVFTSITGNGGTLLLTWSATVGRRYQVQFKTTLTQGNWNDLGAAITATSNTASASDSMGDGQRFYRVVLLP